MTVGHPGGRPREGVLSALMLAVASGAILVPLNSTMLAVALPGIMDDFGLGANDVSSLVTLYLGTVAVALPVSGSLGDRFGHRRIFLVGVVAFGVASLVAAIGSSFVLLEGARVLQAASGALVSTTSAALIRETAAPERRGEAFGFFDLLVSTSAAVGPFVGGLIVGAFGWRTMFFVAVPVALVAAATVGVLLKPASEEHRPAHPVRPLDLPGLGLLALFIVALLVVLRSGLASGPGMIAAIAIAPLFALFLLVEMRTKRPAVDPRLFRMRSFSSAVAGVFGATVVLHGCFFLVPLLVERLLGGSATESGIVLLGIAGVSAVVAPLGGRTSDRAGRRLLVAAGSLVTAAGLAVLALPAGASAAAVVALLLGVVGLGLGLSGSPRQAAAFESVGSDRVGMAAGTYFTGRYLGGVVGASVAGAVLGGTVTTGGVSLGFAILAIVAMLGAGVSLGLPGRRVALPQPR